MKELDKELSTGSLHWKIDREAEIAGLFLDNRLLFFVNQEMMNRFIVDSANVTIKLNRACECNTLKSRAFAIRQAEAILFCATKKE